MPVYDATILIEEFGEEAREEEIGPFTVGSEEELRLNLADRGDVVVSVTRLGASLDEVGEREYDATL